MFIDFEGSFCFILSNSQTKREYQIGREPTEIIQVVLDYSNCLNIDYIFYSIVWMKTLVCFMCVQLIGNLESNTLF